MVGFPDAMRVPAHVEVCKGAIGSKTLRTRALSSASEQRKSKREGLAGSPSAPTRAQRQLYGSQPCGSRKDSAARMYRERIVRGYCGDASPTRTESGTNG